MRTYMAIIAAVAILATTAAFGRDGAAAPPAVSKIAAYGYPANNEIQASWAAQYTIDQTPSPMQTSATPSAPVVLTMGRGGGGMRGGGGSFHGGQFRGGFHRDFDFHGRNFHHRDYDFDRGFGYYPYSYSYGYYPYGYYPKLRSCGILLGIFETESSFLEHPAGFCVGKPM